MRDREDMKRHIEEMVEVTLHNKDVQASDRYWKLNMVWHGPSGLGELHGLEEFKNKLLIPYFRAFPDFVGELEEWAYDEERERAVAWGHITGTHQDVFLGVPATGKHVRYTYTDIWRFEDGLLAENWVQVDTTAILVQLGAVNVPVTLDAAGR